MRQPSSARTALRTLTALLLLLAPLGSNPPHRTGARRRVDPEDTAADHPVDQPGSPTNALPEYPRPQLTRTDWQNLNGIWQFAATGTADDSPPVGTTLGRADPRALPGRVRPLRHPARHENRSCGTGAPSPSRRAGRPPASSSTSAPSTGRATVWVNGTQVGAAQRRLRRVHASTSPPRSTGGTQRTDRRRLRPDRRRQSGSKPRRQAAPAPRRHLLHRRLRHLADRLAGADRRRPHHPAGPDARTSPTTRCA